MTPELNEARDYLKTAQAILAHWRELPHAPRWLAAQAEQRVLSALDVVWLEQCRAVFEDHNDGFFETDSCRHFVNNVDWSESYSVNNGMGVDTVVTVKLPMPW